jgi:hypothetical protein
MRKLMVGIVLALVAGCSGDDCYCYCYKHGYGDLTFGEPLKVIYTAIPNGRDLIRDAFRTTLVDEVGEESPHSISAQSWQVPDPAQDIRFFGLTSRRMSALDLSLLRSHFPGGQGPYGTTFWASDPPSTPGRYVFYHVEYEADVPIDDISADFQYAIVWDSDGDPSNNWVGQGIFDADLFNGTDKWLQLRKQIGLTAELTMSETDGSNVTTVESEAGAFVNGNAAVFMVPYSEFLSRNLFAAARTTTFLNIDGNFGVGNDDGWSSDQAPVQPGLYIPSTPAAASNAPHFELSYHFAASTEDLLTKYGISYSYQWGLEQADPLADSAVTVDLSYPLLGRGAIPDWRSLFTPDTAAGAFLPGVFSTTEPTGDLCSYSRVLGEHDIPFTVGGTGPRKDVGNITFSTNVPAADGTDPTQGDLVGNILDPNSFAAFLAQMEADPGAQVFAQPRLFAVNGQSVATIGHNWQVNVADLPASLQNQAQAIDSNIQFVDTGLSLFVTPHVTPGDVVLMDLEPTIAATVRAQDLTVDGEARGVRLPIIETTGLKTSIVVNSGDTVVIGGILPSGSSTIQPGIPFFQQIPGLGFLFNQRSYDESDDLILCITVNLVDGDD